MSSKIVIKKKLSVVVTIICLACLQQVSAQNGVRISRIAGAANSSAMLDLVTDGNPTWKGLLIPRMTSAQRTAISSPAQSLLVYQTDGATGYYYFEGAAWKQWAAGGLTGSGTTNTVAKWTSSSNVGNSTIIDDGTNVGIGVTPTAKLQIGGTSGVDGIKFPDGTLQKTSEKVLNASFAITAATVQTITSITPTLVTGLSITVTPVSTSSKFYITVVVNGSNTFVNSVLIYRNGVPIMSQTSNSNETGAQSTKYLVTGGGTTATGNMFQNYINYIDAPGTTSNVIYDVRVTSGWAGTAYTTYINDRGSSDMRTPSTMSILELAN